ncbi:helix-turn-helix domain-containing protein [Streptomyces sp. H39-S7]|uniref:helix-turn-helix domain-containing protein n=1 Tax=Streptomyces sp. H39-S7 TaxID=3004357 RepID=UPI0022AFF68D|nr:helix-turn-helix transcriptional regulator [Streptomyces sp. H39-S7]MCZ4117870.1 helix-turn-helix transcriptional regulator [Streptomyces sp. H39-S7]
MPPRSTPSERQRRLGVELRKLRSHVGMAGDAASAVLGVERTRISHIEAGRVDVPRNGLYKLLRAYGCAEGPLFDGLMEMAQERGRGWWDEFRDVVAPVAADLAELESRSAGIRIHESLIVPGLLQTADYARAVISESEHDAERVERYVDFRLARQGILAAPSAVTYRAIIHEAALHTRVGGAKTMRRQLLRLIEAARQPNVFVQVFPYEAGVYSAFSRSFGIFGGATSGLDTVHLEHPLNSVFLRDGQHLDEYAKMFERLSVLALDPVDPESEPESHESRDSLSLIQHVMYSM